MWSSQPLLMKKASIIVLVYLLFVFVAQGQFQYGLKAGLNVANQTKNMSIPQVPNTIQNTKAMLGYQLGSFVKAKLSKHLSLSAEPAFSVVGAGMTLVDANLKSYDVREKIGYVELPLILQYKFQQLYFGAGPSAGIKVFSKLSGFENRSFDITNYKAFDAAGNVVVGYALSKKLDLNARYSHGFTNLIKDPGYSTTKNRFFNLSVLWYLQ